MRSWVVSALLDFVIATSSKRQLNYSKEKNTMRFDYTCAYCQLIWEENHLSADRDIPLEKPCPHCGGGAVSRMVAAPGISYAGAKTVLQRAGSGWNDVLTKIKKSSGRKTTIETR